MFWIECSIRRRTPRRAGFSLITVLLIAMAGMALLGAVAYTLGAFSSTAVEVMYKDEEYNAPQNEIEKTKAALADEMKDMDSPMAYDLEKVKSLDSRLVADDGSITSADALVIYDPDDSGNNPFGMRPDVPWSHGDKAGVLRVRIYDMQYKGVQIAGREKFTSDAEYEAFLADLPPAFPPRPPVVAPEDLDKTFSGVYLVRVTLILEGEEQKQIETAVIRSVGE